MLRWLQSMLRWLRPQSWRERRDAREAYQEALRSLETDFYLYVLAKPDVRERLDVLSSKARDLAERADRRYRLPPTLHLLNTMLRTMHYNMDSESSYSDWAVTSALQARDSTRNAVRIAFLLVSAALLWCLWTQAPGDRSHGLRGLSQLGDDKLTSPPPAPHATSRLIQYPWLAKGVLV